MGIAVDLSSQKTMEQQILHQDRLASIGLLAGGLAHEIGNPLGVIRGRAELVMNQVRGNDIAEQNLSIILGQIDRISGLIQSLLRVSRVPDQTPLKSVSLARSVQDVVELTSEECRRKEISLRFHDVERNLLAEESHLQQLLLNIVINSIHAIEEQKKHDTRSNQVHVIEISSKSLENGNCLLSVRDSGCGISPENLGKLFKPFYTTKEVGKGTGLGLAIVAKLVEEVGGRITVRSDGPGRGAQFDFEFKSS
jgi:two-component system, NtrC family, sensor histidine kinase HydH